MKVDVHILGTDTGDSSPSCVISCDKHRYIFNCGEGLQRLCVEYKVRLSKLSHIFLTQLTTECFGGLPGALLTAADAGKSVVDVVAPGGLVDLFVASRWFYKCGLTLNLHECTHHATSVDAGELQVTPVLLVAKAAQPFNDRVDCHQGASVWAPAKRRRCGDGVAGGQKDAADASVPPKMRSKRAHTLAAGTVPTSPVVNVDVLAERGHLQGVAPHFPKLRRFEEAPLAPDMAIADRYHPSDVVCCYVARTTSVRGKFHPKRAIDLGVPKGPLFGRLHSGHAVTLSDGRVIQPAQCMDPDVPGRVVVIISCPTVAFLPSLTQHPVLAEYQDGTGAGDVALCVHMVPAAVVQTRAYQRWINAFRTGVQHIVVNKAVCSQEITFRAQALMQCRFNTVCSKLFSLPHPLRPLAPATLVRMSSGESGSGDDVSGANADVDMCAKPVDTPTQLAETLKRSAAITAPTVPARPRVRMTSRIRLAEQAAAGDPPAHRAAAPPLEGGGGDLRPSMLSNSATGRIRVGREYQATIPDIVTNKPTRPCVAVERQASSSPRPPRQPVASAAGAGAGAGAGASHGGGAAIHQRPSMLNNTATGRIRVGQDFQAALPTLQACNKPPAGSAGDEGGTLVQRPASDSSGDALFTSDATLPLLPCGAVAARHMLHYSLLPVGRAGLRCDTTLAPIDPTAVAAEVVALPGMRAKLASLLTTPADASMAPVDLEAGFEIVFLGTSSAVPHKYRNVSGILVRMATGKSFLMDCGEGTYGQMVRQFGSHAGGVSHVVKSLCAVWISHMHADHHLGLLRILVERDMRDGRLLVVGPWPLKKWLAEVGTLEPALRGKYTFVDARDLLCSASCSLDDSEPTTGHKRTRERAEDDSSARRAAAVETVRHMMRVQNLRTVQVKHCYMSFGVRVDLATGTSVVYSGDCRPSDALVALGQGCTILIHEATFEDGMEKDAKAKKHTTVGEALAVAERMAAKAVLLTHFSARYPKLPSLGERTNLAIAFDLMRVNRHTFAELYRVFPVLQLLFESDDDDPAADTSSAVLAGAT